MEHTIPITIWLAERSYRIRVKPEEEQAIRHAIKVAEQRLAKLRNEVSGKDEQDFLAMCLMMYATDQVTEQSGLNPVQQDTIQQMMTAIDECLKD
ncbi:MAG TPA: cell division protein ZapA [Edaphocola sp.]|nr:cell division protein ZapA [Edaphocola sp.]